MSKICYGCGAKLQFKDASKPGYVKEEKYEDSKYCERCFKLIHYGVEATTSEPKKISQIVSTVNKNAKNVVFLVDFINLIDDIIDIFKSIRVPKILVVSKSDIIPKNVSFSQIRNYLRVVYGIRDEVIFTSKKSNLNTFIKSLYNKEEVYFLGLTNAGKSTLINMLIDKYESKNTKLTTSYKENTTQDFIRIKIGDMTLVDSPGFVLDNFALDKNSNIEAEIKPITYQNKVKCSYKLDNLLNVSFNNETNLVFYFSKNVKIKRDFKHIELGISFKVSGNSDIVICGLGFIKVTDDTTITLSEDMMKYVHIRPSIVGGKYE